MGKLEISENVKKAADLLDEWSHATTAFRNLSTILRQPLPPKKHASYSLKLSAAIVKMRNYASEFEAHYKTLTIPEKIQLYQLRDDNARTQ